jgi:hypothetical protein
MLMASKSFNERLKSDISIPRIFALALATPLYLLIISNAQITSEGARVRHLHELIETYNETAAAVLRNGEVEYRQTENPTSNYDIHFACTGVVSVKAESEEAARKWAEQQVVSQSFYYCNIENIDCEIINSCESCSE